MSWSNIPLVVGNQLEMAYTNRLGGVGGRERAEIKMTRLLSPGPGTLGLVEET